MRLLVISNAPLIQKNSHWFAYAPYVKEMEIWAKYADEVAFCCTQWKKENDLLIAEVPFSIHKFFFLTDFNTNSFLNLMHALLVFPFNLWRIWRAMFWADHIHLRCPGNVGLLASMIQILFPHKIKTVKYAGNWDPKAPTPWTYRLQKAILSNVLISKKMKVLVYGAWQNASSNILPFFTASYFEKDKLPVVVRDFSGKINFIFVGMLTEGKQPLYAVQLVENLLQKGYNVGLKLYGDGKERTTLENYLQLNILKHTIEIIGNVPSSEIKEVYKNAHFVILPSKSEGWPKVIAEGMFWGCIPIATKVSCVPYMLQEGERGILLDLNLSKDCDKIEKCICDPEIYTKMQLEAQNWSRNYTLDTFELEIKKLVKG